jgi:nucleotide-binding universal stress UspA family protein
MLSKAIYAVSFEANQPEALRSLAALKDAGCQEMVLLHVATTGKVLRHVPMLLREEMRQQLERVIGDTLDEWAEVVRGLGLAARSEVREADLPWMELCEVARHAGSGLMVVGPTVGGELGCTSHFLMHAASEALLILRVRDGRLYDASCAGLFQRILFPTDFSECARKAERYILQLAAAGAREVIVVHVLEPAVLERGEQRQAVERQVESQLARSRSTFEEAGLTVKCRILEGPVGHAIVEAAEQEGASLVVMGSTGKSVAEGMQVGSVSERVSRLTDRSLLLVY